MSMFEREQVAEASAKMGYREMEQQRDELARLCAVLVLRLGGEVKVSAADMQEDIVLSRSTLRGVPGVAVISARKAK